MSIWWYIGADIIMFINLIIFLLTNSKDEGMVDF